MDQGAYAIQKLIFRLTKERQLIAQSLEYVRALKTQHSDTLLQESEQSCHRAIQHIDYLIEECYVLYRLQIGRELIKPNTCVNNNSTSFNKYPTTPPRDKANTPIIALLTAITVLLLCLVLITLK